MSADFFERKMHNLLVQAKIAPIKGGPKNGGGSGGGSTIDNTAPTINITSPAAGTNITAGIPVTIAITASDNVGVSSEIFSVDGVQQAGVNGTTASFTWNTTGVTGGTHTITVAAKDVAGNTGIATVVVTVNSTIITPPPPQSSGFEIAMPPITSQGSEGSCVAFAVGYSARSSEQFTKTGATSYSYGTNILSPEYLFDQTKTDPSTCSGSTVLDALDLLKAKGICTWQSMPYSSSNGCSLVPTAAQDAEAANYKITNYSMLYTSDISAVKAMLDMKHPLVFTFNVDSYFYNAGPGFIWKSFSGTIIGGHAAAICGYDDTRHAYKIINSWGTGWGDAGYGWIDYDFMPSVSAMALSLTL
jgi:Cysteine protease